MGIANMTVPEPAVAARAALGVRLGGGRGQGRQLVSLPASPEATQFQGLRSAATIGHSSRLQSHGEAFLRSVAAQTTAASTSSQDAFPRARGRRAVVSAVFERFTERAIRAIMAAQKEASTMRRKEVATEQLLLGLIAVEGRHGQEGSLFGSVGITSETVTAAFQALLSGESPSYIPLFNNLPSLSAGAGMCIMLRRLFSPNLLKAPSIYSNISTKMQ